MSMPLWPLLMLLGVCARAGPPPAGDTIPPLEQTIRSIFNEHGIHLARTKDSKVFVAIKKAAKKKKDPFFHYLSEDPSVRKLLGPASVSSKQAAKIHAALNRRPPTRVADQNQQIQRKGKQNRLRRSRTVVPKKLSKNVPLEIPTNFGT